MQTFLPDNAQRHVKDLCHTTQLLTYLSCMYGLERNGQYLTHHSCRPELRDGLIYDLRDYILPSQSFGTTVNWHKGLEAAVDINPNTGKMTLSVSFIEHVWDLENWSFSGGFAAVFPELRRRYRILTWGFAPCV